MKIERSGGRDVYALPVSYSQERMWFLERLEPGTPLYNIPYIATMRGSVHRDAFNRALNRLIARHESLRTCFIEQGGEPRQAIYPKIEVEVDWIELGPSASNERLQAICTEVTSSPFDLSKAPLFRTTVVGLGRQSTIITTIHHIISDGWSLGVFQRELSALYQEELGGRSAELPELRVQYADYAVWQRELLLGEGLEKLKRYWTKQLAGAPTILELPGDYPRPPKQTHTGDVHLYNLDAELSASIKELATGREATLFMTVFAAFAVLLYRVTGADDVLVGTPIAGRKSADVENLIGLFVNTLVLRARMQPDMSFTSLLAEVKTMTLEAFEYQDIPFEKLVLEVNPKRDLSRSPLIQILFTLQNIPPLQALMAEGGEAPAGASQNLDGHTGTSKFDFALFVSEVGDELQCSIEFNTDLFSLETIKEIGGLYEALLRAIVADPDATLASYPIMSAAQRERCLELSRGPVRAFSENLGCHQLFERQAQATPDAVALAIGTGDARKQLTYAELDAHATRIARHLQARGVVPGDKVGICMPRSLDQIAALLAIVKAGAAYVPLDPTYPLDRLRFILADIDARLVIVSRNTGIELDESATKLVLEDEAGQLDQYDTAPLGLDHSPEAPLYVIYTSGSTGKPKGVVMPHRSIVNLVEWQARESAAAPGALTLQFASLNFDVASQEVFSTLSSGGCLQLVDEEIRRESPKLLDYLRETKVSRLFLPPVALEQLINAAVERPVELDALREVIVAGDKLQVTDNVRAVFEKLPRARLINQYGPTESHVVSAQVLTGPASSWPEHPPIGKPVDNVALYVLDAKLEPVPLRVAGELYIGGSALALGYLNAPSQTRARFIDDPFTPGGRLYRTGDLVRYNGEGVLVFLGRNDQQIKLRGFRIEPGEIEVVLKRHPGIEDAVVIKRQSSRGDDELAAYLITKPDAAPDRASLRAQLGAELPAYMVPNHFVRLDRFPMTGSGKIDRRSLPDPAEFEVVRDDEADFIAPRTPVEEVLVNCWREVLQVDQVSVRDNFFDLGGHSLTATQLVSRIRDHFSIDLPLFRVFERPTPEQLAVEVVLAQAAREEQAELEALLAELESLSEEDSEALLSQ